MVLSELELVQVAKLLASLRTQTASAQTPEAALALGCLLADDINHERSTLSSAIAGLQALLASSDALVQQVRSLLLIWKIALQVSQPSQSLSVQACSYLATLRHSCL